MERTFEDDPAWQRAYARHLKPDAPNATGRKRIRDEAVEEMYQIECRYEAAPDA